MRNGSLIGSDEASMILGVHRATFLRWVQAGLIKPAIRMPGIRGAQLFRLADVEKLASEKEATA